MEKALFGVHFRTRLRFLVLMVKLGFGLGIFASVCFLIADIFKAGVLAKLNGIALVMSGLGFVMPFCIGVIWIVATVPANLTFHDML